MRMRSHAQTWVGFSSSQLSGRNREENNEPPLDLIAKSKPEDWPHITVASASVDGKWAEVKRSLYDPFPRL